MPLNEHQIQCQLFQWWRYKSSPELRPLMFAIPNGGQRNARTGAMLKREGALAGVPDICLAVPRRGYHGLWLELKVRGGVIQQSQKFMLERLSSAGYLALAAFGYDHAVNTICDYLDNCFELYPPDCYLPDKNT